MQGAAAHNIGMVLTAVALLALVIFIAPSVMARNRGNILRNIAIWLAIFVVLGLLYQHFGIKGTPQSGDIQGQPAPSKHLDGKSFTPPSE